jgi:hypothetical protein
MPAAAINFRKSHPDTRGLVHHDVFFYLYKASYLQATCHSHNYTKYTLPLFVINKSFAFTATNNMAEPPDFNLDCLATTNTCVPKLPTHPNAPKNEQSG